MRRRVLVSATPETVEGSVTEIIAHAKTSIWEFDKEFGELPNVMACRWENETCEARDVFGVQRLLSPTLGLLKRRLEEDIPVSLIDFEEVCSGSIPFSRVMFKCTFKEMFSIRISIL